MSDRSPFLPDNMRARFHELGRQRDAILAKSAPLRQRRDRLVAEMESAVSALNVEVKEAETGLFDIDSERGALARALGGKTGEPS